MTVSVMINGVPCDMDVDTGATISLVSESTFRTLWRKRPPVLEQSNVRLRTYTGEILCVLGVATVVVEYAEQREELQLYVVSGAGPSLLGRDWLSKIKLDWKSLNHISSFTSLEDVLGRHTAVFEQGLGKMNDATARIHVDPSAEPRFLKARPVPYALRARVEQELERLQGMGVIEPIQ